MADWLEYNGFTVATKPAQKYKDASGQRRIKGNIDIEITVDAMRLALLNATLDQFGGRGSQPIPLSV